MAYSEEEITNERLQYALDIHRADITKMLSDMCANYLLESSGHGRGTKYHVYGTNVPLPDSNVTLTMDTSGANVTLPGSNVTLECYTSESNVTLPKRYTKEQLREKFSSRSQPKSGNVTLTFSWNDQTF